MKKRVLLTTLLMCASTQAAWVGIIGVENARTVSPTEKGERQQVETIVQGVGLSLGEWRIDNTSAAKWNRDGDLTVARNWTYAYFDDNHGLSLDLIKGDWSGQGPSIVSGGYAYKGCWSDLCVRINPALAMLNNKTQNGNQTNHVQDYGFKLNAKFDNALTDSFKLGFHPQYATWQDDINGATLKLDFNASLDLSQDKRHKLMLVHERFAVNNRATDMKTRFVGEGDPIAGYVAGTESTFKLRYVYVF